MDRPSYDTGHVYVTPANPQRLRNSKVNWIVILRYISIISSGCNLESRNVFLFSTSESFTDAQIRHNSSRVNFESVSVFHFCQTVQNNSMFNNPSFFYLKVR